MNKIIEIRQDNETGLRRFKYAEHEMQSNVK